MYWKNNPNVLYENINIFRSTETSDDYLNKIMQWTIIILVVSIVFRNLIIFVISIVLIVINLIIYHQEIQADIQSKLNENQQKQNKNKEEYLDNIIPLSSHEDMNPNLYKSISELSDEQLNDRNKVKLDPRIYGLNDPGAYLFLSGGKPQRRLYY